jgi:hypothetical protein
MMSSQFNAIDYAQQLEDAGVPKAQAEVHARTLAQIVGSCLALPAELYALRDELTTCLTLFEQKMIAQMEAFEARVNLSLAYMKSDIRLLKWICGVNTAMLIGLIVKAYFP